MTTVTFVGGPLDLTRAAVERLDRTYRVAQAKRFPTGGGIEGSLYDDLGFFESVYNLATAYDNSGREQHIYVWSHDTDRTPSEIMRLRQVNAEQSKALDLGRRERADLQASLFTVRDLRAKDNSHGDQIIAEKTAEIARLNKALTYAQDVAAKRFDALTDIRETAEQGQATIDPVKPARRLDGTQGCAVVCLVCDRNYGFAAK